MTIKMKLISIIMIFIITLVFSGGYSIYLLKNTDKTFQEVQEDKDILVHLKSIQYRITGISNDERAYLLVGEESLPEQIKEKTTEIEELFDEIERSKIENSDLQIIKQIKSSQSEYLAASNRLVEEKRNGNDDAAVTIHFQEQREIRKETLEPLVNSLIAEIEKEVSQDNLTVKKMQTIREAILIGVSLASILGGLVWALLTIRSILKPLNLMNNKLKEISDGEGDLTQHIRLDSKDELSQMAKSFNQMIEKLASLVRQIGLHADQVAASSEQLTVSAEETSKATEHIALTVQELDAGTTKQVNNASNSVKTVNGISSAIRQVAMNTENVSETVILASNRAEDGNHSIKKVVTQMDDINQTVGELSDDIKMLGEQSNQIGKIVEVITSIAQQTNLLALNAAIEAARAGENGKGFAVVADEVRKLAEQSAQSAQQISELIASIQNNTEKSVQSMEKTTVKMDEGLQLVTIAGKSFDEIQLSVQDISVQIKEILLASQKMSSGAEQMVQSVNIITNLSESAAAGTREASVATEEQLASMEEISAAAASLSHMADELKMLVGKFKV